MDSHPATPTSPAGPGANAVRDPATNATPATGPAMDEADSTPGGVDERGHVDGTSSAADAPRTPGGQSPLREASSTVAGAIESVLAASDTRHQQVADTLAYLRQRQQEAEDRLSQMEREQHRVAQTASAILSNQKTSARCYDEVTAALSAIRKHQQEDAQRLNDLAARTRRAETALRNTVLFAAVAQAVIIPAAIGLAVWLLG